MWKGRQTRANIKHYREKGFTAFVYLLLELEKIRLSLWN